MLIKYLGDNAVMFTDISHTVFNPTTNNIDFRPYDQTLPVIRMKNVPANVASRISIELFETGKLDLTSHGNAELIWL